MKSKWVTGIGKLGFTLLFFYTTSTLIKNASDLQKKKLNHKNIIAKNNDQQRNCYFVGSSRTSTMFNDSMMNALLPEVNFVNAGIPGSTFLFNKLLVEKIFEQPGNKTVFVELSVVNARQPNFAEILFTGTDMVKANAPLWKNFSVNRLLFIAGPACEKYLLKQFMVNSELIAIAKPSAFGPLWGFNPPKTVTKKRSPWGVYSRQEVKPFEPAGSFLFQLVKEMIDSSAKKNTSIIFYLPPAMKTKQELALLSEVYEQIPVGNKLLYTNSFIGEIQKPKYFSDLTHLNDTGAVLFTKYTLQEALRNGWFKE